MAVCHPLKVQLLNKPPASVVANWESGKYARVPHMPFDASLGYHPVPAHDEDFVYIEQADFRQVDDKDFFGLAPNKAVGLKYSGRIFCESYEVDSKGEPSLLKCRFLDDEDETKVKTHIQWVGHNKGATVEVRLYNNLFKTEEPSDDDWEADLNPDSEVVLSNARVDPSIFLWNPMEEKSFQFERIGFFTVDKDSSLPAAYKAPESPSLATGTSQDFTVEQLDTVTASAKDAKLVLNLTVALASSKPKASAAKAAGPNRSRKEEQMAAAAEKERMKSIPPQEMFKVGANEGLYKEYDADGIPTVLENGEPVTKSAGKKLKKEWEKQKKLYESAKK
jgi:glutaminyl-tRNA synthetase